MKVTETDSHFLASENKKKDLRLIKINDLTLTKILEFRDEI